MANPSRLDKIQITGNSNSGTATKVNVQEANGEVNTQTINTGFNKNIGLNSGDVVGASTLLNQYSTTPVDWTATTFNSGQVVFYAGKQWMSKEATVAGDVPNSSSKWEEITFESLANKTVDQTIIDGSTNAVSGNAVFDALATKAPISSVHNPVTIGTANGLSLSTQQLSLGLASSGIAGALSGTDWNNFNSKFNTPTGLTTNFLPKWNGSGFENSILNEDNGSINVNKILEPSVSNEDVYAKSAFRFPAGSVEPSDINYYPLITGLNTITGEGFSNQPSFGWMRTRSGNFSTNGAAVIQISGDGTPIRRWLFMADGSFRTPGTISASPATTANQVPTWGQVQAIAKPYKAIVFSMTQSGTSTPTSSIRENNSGGTFSLSRNGVGITTATFSGISLTGSKTVIFVNGGNGPNSILKATYVNSTTIQFNNYAFNTANLVDGLSGNETFVEIRIYP